MSDNKKNFSDNRNLCLTTLILLGNYFALIGLLHADKALQAHMNGNLETADSHAKKARAWALWGLIPSSIINIALIWFVCAMTIKIFSSALKGLSF